MCENKAHFYEKPTKGYVSEDGWDLQKIDMGIALCHFELAAKESGFDVTFENSDPALPIQDGMKYIATYVLKEQ